MDPPATLFVIFKRKADWKLSTLFRSHSEVVPSHSEVKEVRANPCFTDHVQHGYHLHEIVTIAM
jgi:hypothetical protein